MVRDWGKVKKCCQFSRSKKKTVAHAVNSLIDINSSNRIFHNSSSESVINSGKKNDFDESQYMRIRLQLRERHFSVQSEGKLVSVLDGFVAFKFLRCR